METEIKKILIVDDQIFNLIILEEILKTEKHFEIIKASNGEEAVHLVLEHN